MVAVAGISSLSAYRCVSCVRQPQQRFRRTFVSTISNLKQNQNSRSRKHSFSSIQFSNVLQDPSTSPHPFDTYTLVRELQLGEFTLAQSVAIMEGIRHNIIKQTMKASQMLLSKSDLENEAYLFRAALSELRTEIQVHRRNDAAALRAAMTILSREVDNLNQKLREDTQTLKNDIALDVNNRKAESRTDHKLIEMRIQECNNKFTIKLGDVKTEIEQMKWDTMRKGIFSVFGFAAVFLVTYFYITGEPPPEAFMEENDNNPTSTFLIDDTKTLQLENKRISGRGAELLSLPE